MKYVPPVTTQTAFNCPHCAVLTSQTWFKVLGRPFNAPNRLPIIIEEIDDHEWLNIHDEKKRAQLVAMIKRALEGFPFFDDPDVDIYAKELVNCSASRCFECKRVSLWLRNRLVYPELSGGLPANPDLPRDILADYDEASAVLHRSPRSAAALMRLCIQKLMVHFQLPGKNINDDIKVLVDRGLDTRIQKALDAVRVIGNNAVHPGTMDLRDDRQTAESLFRLLNLIVEKMISEPKHVDEVYNLLPAEARAAIEKRDKPKVP